MRRPSGGVAAVAAVAAVATVVLALGACSDDGDDGGTDEPATTTTVDATTTTTGDDDEPTSTTSGATAAEPCPEVAPPTADGGSNADSRTELEADVDGDGDDDVASVFRADDGWHLRVDVGAGGAVDEMLTTVPTDDATIEITRDHDGDGSDELWVVVGHGASSTVYGLYDLDGCDLEPVALGGGPAEFAIGGPVLLLQGVRCEDDGRITHLGATSNDGESYTTLDLTYELQGGELVRVDDATTTLTNVDPELQAYTSFDC